jgi:hypothetical protein
VSLLTKVLLFSISSSALANTPSIQCTQFVKRLSPHWAALWSKKPLELNGAVNTQLREFGEWTEEDCKDPAKASSILQVFQNYRSKHNGKVVYILPLTSKDIARPLIRGIKAASEILKEEVVVIDSNQKGYTIDTAISEAMFKHDASIIVGGFDQNEILPIVKWSLRLEIPTVIINKKPANIKANPLQIYVHPTLESLSQALVDANRIRKHQRISILRPSSPFSNSLSQNYKSIAANNGITVLHDEVYSSTRPEQIESAARKLFQLSPNDRREELEALYISAKERAAKERRPFNVKEVFLSPKMTQDAVLILDQFRNTRAVVSMLKFLGVKNLAIFGTSELRSRGLIEPWEPILRGSYFVDYIGSYQQMPKGLESLASSQPAFAPTETIDEIDFANIGYRVAQVASHFAKRPDGPRRLIFRDLNRSANGVTRFDEGYFSWDKYGQIVWPFFLFQVSATNQPRTGEIRLLGPTRN